MNILSPSFWLFYEVGLTSTNVVTLSLRFYNWNNSYYIVFSENNCELPTNWKVVPYINNKNAKKLKWDGRTIDIR